MKLFASQPVLIEPTFESWRATARSLLAAGTDPETVDIFDSEPQTSGSLFAGAPGVLPASQDTAIQPSVPQAFLQRAPVVACHRAPHRWNLLYRLLWRLQRQRNLLRDEIDDDVAAFRSLEHQVNRDLHKMHAFVRFRKVESSTGEEYVAWYEPDHHILQLAAPFFAERFAVMRWAILTPESSVAWSPAEKQLTFGPGVPRDQAPQGDDFEALWRTYYASIFNPARTNLNAMRSEMPLRYWKNLPELQTLPQLLTEAGARVDSMLTRQPKVTAAAFVPEDRTLPVLQQAIPACRGCGLYRCATQPVFGRGPHHARMMLVGEQPGDEEDRAGTPFIGPSGGLLDKLLLEANIDRSAVYVTNAVKHFKFTQRGGRRLHEHPRASEIFACRPWLLAEIEAVQPELIVCLGASASKSLFGANFALMQQRGKVLASPYADRVIATLHPSAILRVAHPARSAEMQSLLLTDLQTAAGILRSPRPCA